jgi:hypothetical protein
MADWKERFKTIGMNGRSNEFNEIHQGFIDAIGRNFLHRLAGIQNLQLFVEEQKKWKREIEFTRL